LVFCKVCQVAVLDNQHTASTSRIALAVLLVVDHTGRAMARLHPCLHVCKRCCFGRQRSCKRCQRVAAVCLQALAHWQRLANLTAAASVIQQHRQMQQCGVQLVHSSVLPSAHAACRSMHPFADEVLSVGSRAPWRRLCCLHTAAGLCNG
jgi:hypothetical protein